MYKNIYGCLFSVFNVKCFLRHKPANVDAETTILTDMGEKKLRLIESIRLSSCTDAKAMSLHKFHCSEYKYLKKIIN